MSGKQNGLLAAIVLATAGFVLCCGETAQTLPANDLVIEGVQREYNLFVPNRPPDTPMPLMGPMPLIGPISAHARRPCRRPCR